MTRTILSEERNQALGKSVTEHELGSDDEDLGCKTLEEGADTLSSDHFTDNGHAANLRVEVGVLNSGLRKNVSVKLSRKTERLP